MKPVSTILVVALLSLAGCSADRASAPTATQGTPAGVGDGSASSPTPASERDKIVQSYNQFWQRIQDAAGRPESEWRLNEVATDPQLSRTTQGLELLHQQSLTTYGQVTARISDVDIDGSQSTVVDCQDGSSSGQADARTGTRKTVGVARNPIRASLQRGNDGHWRISDINYPGGEC